MNSVELDDLDRKITHALQIDGRVSFALVAEVLGVSDQTVARRYHRLRSAGILRVVGLPDTAGLVLWLLRLQCVPEAAATLAAGLAQRPDTSWVSLTSAGTEIVCFARASGHRRQDSALLGRLPRVAQVKAVSAYCVLRTYFGGATGWGPRASALDATQIGRLRPDRPTTAASHPPPDDIDRALFAALAIDGRSSLRVLAEATGLSTSAVQRRLENLRAAKALYFDVDIDTAALGYPTQAMLWLSVPPSELASVGTELAEHEEVAFAAATTGATNLAAIVGCRDIDDLYHYIEARLGTIPAVRHLETAPIFHQYKRAGNVPGTSR
ncbi:Lrp/AsnC family transcriptional regulator [Nocardia macrotermitis]|uniref:Lrp/AsnC family transcriptional regulator n=1 Tax=Nocardia macrotermitis TaxID=2585198 RepID=UPI0029E7D1F0|nr:AsnC family transcriptional regulator [Nocardia macrotermitis]